MRFGYADPPYLGLAKKFYGHLHPDAADYDRIETHAALIKRLEDEFPDGWAMSLHTPSLRHILPLCPENVRVMAWVKPFASFKPGVGVAYAWEPVIFGGGAQALKATKNCAGLMRRQHHAQERLPGCQAARLRALGHGGIERAARG